MNLIFPSDPYSGRNSPGPRFRFRDRFISRKTFWLPVAMKRDPDFTRLLDILHYDGRYADPSIRPLARDKFNQLCLKYDFTFWAATIFRNPDSIRGIDFALLHLADISAWTDPNGSRSEKVTQGAFPAVWRLPQSMVILDGAPTHRNRYFNRFLRSTLLSETNFTPILLQDPDLPSQ